MQIGAHHAKAVALTAIPQQQLAMFEATQQIEQQLLCPLSMKEAERVD